MAAIAAVDNRETVRCDFCSLVQFTREGGKCRRCKKDYNRPAVVVQPVEQVGNVDPSTAANPGESCTAATSSAFPHLYTNLRVMREALGLSQKQLAKRMGVARTYISKVETGKCTPIINQLQRYADALYTSPMDLITGKRTVERDEFMLEFIAALPHLNDRNRAYLVDMVRRLATTEEKKTA